MKETLEKLMKDANERLKELDKRYNTLRDEYGRQDATRAKCAAKIKNGEGFSDDRNNLYTAENRLPGLRDQMQQLQADIAGQQQYIANITSQYVELVRVERGVSQASQYSSNAASGFFVPPSTTAAGPR